MPDYAETQLVDTFQRLDSCIASDDSAGATRCCERICELDRQSMRNFGPTWLSDIVKNKGIRLPNLEHALKVDKVVLGGSIELKHGFIDALTGKKPLKVDQVKLELKIEF